MIFFFISVDNVWWCVCIRLPVQMHAEQIEVGSHFVSLLRKFTSFWCKNLASFSRADMRSIKLACQWHFLICYYTGTPSSMRDTGRDLCASVVIWASRRALRNGEIIRICMGKKWFLLQFKNTNEFSIKISLPGLPCLLSFLPCGFWSDWARF